MTEKPSRLFYREYYLTDKGVCWAKGHVGFKNPFLNFLLELRTRISIVGKRQRFFARSLDKKRGGLVLDLGCGGGNDLFIKYGKVVGVDLEMCPLKSAKNVYACVSQADITSLPFKDNTFDYVVSADVIGHIPAEYKDKLLSEIYRVIKKGGRTAHAIETDAENRLYSFAHKYPDLFRKSFIEEIGGHFGLEKPTQVLERFERHGFKLVNKEKIWGCIWPIEEYVYRFDNEYKNKSKTIKAIVFICKILSRNILIHAVTNVFMGIINYFVEAPTPLNHAGGILVLYEK